MRLEAVRVAMPPISRPVRLELTLTELHEAIAESVRIALAANGHRIVDADGNECTAEKSRELGRNAAGCLMLFVTEDE